ncbi:putative cytosolic protein [Reticulomyxa filosa]|uniref:Putative cytosolic protein n=1 Tax=Reticulomyxa filosa TaxID=46433 RepID=X6NGG0_RETFI|nr:putative cytosolic protein [Reticulomyxa filosa]|eukprot:ETO24427.1 putative cytosolic protein [Reticulomyxa filosa]
MFYGLIMLSMILYQAYIKGYGIPYSVRKYPKSKLIPLGIFQALAASVTFVAVSRDIPGSLMIILLQLHLPASIVLYKFWHQTSIDRTHAIAIMVMFVGAIIGCVSISLGELGNNYYQADKNQYINAWYYAGVLIFCAIPGGFAILVREEMHAQVPEMSSDLLAWALSPGLFFLQNPESSFGNFGRFLSDGLSCLFNGHPNDVTICPETKQSMVYFTVWLIASVGVSVLMQLVSLRLTPILCRIAVIIGMILAFVMFQTGVPSFYFTNQLYPNSKTGDVLDECLLLGMLCVTVGNVMLLMDFSSARPAPLLDLEFEEVTKVPALDGEQIDTKIHQLESERWIEERKRLREQKQRQQAYRYANDHTTEDLRTFAQKQTHHAHAHTHMHGHDHHHGHGHDRSRDHHHEDDQFRRRSYHRQYHDHNHNYDPRNHDQYHYYNDTSPPPSHPHPSSSSSSSSSRTTRKNSWTTPNDMSVPQRHYIIEEEEEEVSTPKAEEMDPTVKNANASFDYATSDNAGATTNDQMYLEYLLQKHHHETNPQYIYYRKKRRHTFHQEFYNTHRNVSEQVPSASTSTSVRDDFSSQMFFPRTRSQSMNVPYMQHDLNSHSGIGHNEDINRRQAPPPPTSSRERGSSHSTFYQNFGWSKSANEIEREKYRRRSLDDHKYQKESYLQKLREQQEKRRIQEAKRQYYKSGEMNTGIMRICEPTKNDLFLEEFAVSDPLASTTDEGIEETMDSDLMQTYASR